MTDADRTRLAAILGMLGSDSAGERDNAARMAEQFRKQHKATWAELVEGKTIYVSREIIVEKPVYRDRDVVREVVVEKPVYIDREVPVMVQIPDRRSIPLRAFDRYLVLIVLAIPFLVAMIAAYLRPA